MPLSTTAKIGVAVVAGLGLGLITYTVYKAYGQPPSTQQYVWQFTLTNAYGTNEYYFTGTQAQWNQLKAGYTAQGFAVQLLTKTPV